MAQPVKTAADLPLVRRFEAAAFRSWPAASVHYDGTWLIRLTEGMGAKRLNSVNPLDPGDSRDMEARIERAARRFDEFGRPLVFRISPLGEGAVSAHLDSHGWGRFSESIVMRARLADLPLEREMSQIPLKDVARFTKAALAVHGLDDGARAGLAETIGAIEPEVGLFAIEQQNEPVATAICVHDGDLAGLFEIAVSAAAQGRGHGRRIVVSALKWARMRGASLAWLQVEADNARAISLYRSLGFHDAYRYHYRAPPK